MSSSHTLPRPHAAAARPRTGLFADGGIMEDFDELEDMTYWINCAGTSPVSSKLSAIKTPLNALSNAASDGFWDEMKGVTTGGSSAGACYTATASIGAHVGTTPLSGEAPSNGGKACTTATDGTIVFDYDTRNSGTVLCKSRQTVRSWSNLQPDSTHPPKSEQIEPKPNEHARLHTHDDKTNALPPQCPSRRTSRSKTSTSSSAARRRDPRRDGLITRLMRRLP